MPPAIPCPSCGALVAPNSCSPSLMSTTWFDVSYACSCGSSGVQQVTAQYLQHAGTWIPEEKPKPETVPEPERVIHGSCIGYRAWRIKDWALTGTGVNRAWHPGVNEATCDTGDVINNTTWAYALGAAYGNHPAPALGCHCGITALARFAKTDSHWAIADVFGAIEAWSDETVCDIEPGDVAAAAGVEVKGELPEHEHGRFFIHSTGFRAQYAKVVLLCVEDDWPAAKKAAVRALAKEHEADVCKQAHLEDAAKEHGQLVPDDVLEWAKEGEYEEVAGSHLPTVLPSGATITSSSPWVYSNPVFGFTTNQVRSAFGLPGLLPPKPKPGQKGIKQTLGYPGPPQGRRTTYRKGDRVRDKKGQVWECVKGGKPGRWEAEDFDQGGS